MNELSKVIFVITTALCVSLCGISKAALPTVSSGTLNTHLSADFGAYESQGGNQTPNGGSVGFWLDQSGNGHNALQIDSAKKPKLVHNVINGRPSLRFNGISNFIEIFMNTKPLTRPNTIFVALLTRSGGTELIFDGVTSTNRQLYAVGRTSYEGLWQMWAGSYLVSNTSVRPGVWSYHTLVYGDSVGTCYIYGEETASGAVGPRTLGNGMRLGTNQPLNKFIDMDFAELIIYEGALDESDRLAIEGYLVSKYNISKPYGPDNVGAGILYAKYDGNNVSVGEHGVVAWNDQVGDLDLLANDPNYPELVDVTFLTGVKPVLKFDPSSPCFLRSTPLEVPIDEPMSIFVVARRGDSSSARFIFDGLEPALRRAFSQNTSGNNQIFCGLAGQSFPADHGLWQVFSVIFNGGWSQVFIDGFYKVDGQYVNSGDFPFGGFTVGASFSGGSLFDGEIAEILLYQGALDDQNRQSVEDSLFAKYGITPTCGASYTEYSKMDFNFDCIVDMADLSIFASHWLENTDPAIAN